MTELSNRQVALQAAVTIALQGRADSWGQRARAALLMADGFAAWLDEKAPPDDAFPPAAAQRVAA